MGRNILATWLRPWSSNLILFNDNHDCYHACGFFQQGYLARVFIPSIDPAKVDGGLWGKDMERNKTPWNCVGNSATGQIFLLDFMSIKTDLKPLHVPSSPKNTFIIFGHIVFSLKFPEFLPFCATKIPGISWKKTSRSCFFS